MNVIPLEQKEKSARVVALRPQKKFYAVAAALVAGIAASVMFFYTQTNAPSIAPVTAEAYLIDQSLGEPTDVAEAVVYDHRP